MRRFRYAIVESSLFLCLVSLSCDDHPVQPESSPSTTQPASPHTGHPGTEGASKIWDSGSIVRVQVEMEEGVPSQYVKNEIRSAIQKWNQYVFDLPEGHDSLPHLIDTVYTSYVVQPKIIIEYSELGSAGWCGAKDGFVRSAPEDSAYVVTVIRRDSASSQCGRVVDDLDGVVSHEMAYAFGFIANATPETYWCVSNATESGDMNPSPCSFEQQAVYAAYGLRSGNIPNDTLLTTNVEILTGADTVLVNDTVTFTMTALSGPEPSNSDGPADTVPAVVTWSSRNGSILGIVDQTENSVRVTGIAAGAAELIVTADSATTTVWPWPADTVAVVVVRASGLDPCFDQEDTSTSRYVDQFLEAEAVCGTTGSGYEYRWKFTHLGSWTPYSIDRKYEFPGHSSPGTKTVHLEVKKTSTGDTAQFSKQFSVGSTIISLSGPTYVTDKLLKTYTASQTGDWYERFHPDQYDAWGYATSSNSSTYNRIWAAGEYDVALRNTKTVSGELRRRRLDIEVCWQCGPMELVSSSDLSVSVLDSTRLDPWGIFGAGPWIVGGTDERPELARFYDLTGLHDERSPFADPGWILGDGGMAEDSQGRWQVEWTKLMSEDPNVLGFEFTVMPHTSDSYEFGLAIDPDLGSPVDDKSGYDPDRGMVYVFDRNEALGILLRGSGRDALAKVREYGARTLAPRAEREAWKATRDASVELAASPDDVQLLLAADSATLSTAWQMWLVRGSNVEKLNSLADQVLARH